MQVNCYLFLVQEEEEEEEGYRSGSEQSLTALFVAARMQ
jgi:hypothetical protein